MIDTHCHLDVPRFEPDREAVLARAWAAGVEGLLVPAIGPRAWEPLLAWPGREPRVQVALGIHPQLLPELPEADDARHLETLDRLLGRGVAAAVGECGLDGPTAAAGASLARQARVLRAHLELARAHRLPVLVHCLKAHPALLEVLGEAAPGVPVLLHSYSGSAELVPRYARLGCAFSFAGPVTFLEARRPLEAMRAVPEALLHAETDAPDQAPHPHRGQRSEPGYLPLVVGAMAAARGVGAEALGAALAANARRLFGRWR